MPGLVDVIYEATVTCRGSMSRSSQAQETARTRRGAKPSVLRADRSLLAPLLHARRAPDISDCVSPHTAALHACISARSEISRAPPAIAHNCCQSKMLCSDVIFCNRLPEQKEHTHEKLREVRTQDATRQECYFLGASGLGAGMKKKNTERHEILNISGSDRSPLCVRVAGCVSVTRRPAWALRLTRVRPTFCESSVCRSLRFKLKLEAGFNSHHYHKY